MQNKTKKELLEIIEKKDKLLETFKEGVRQKDTKIAELNTTVRTLEEHIQKQEEGIQAIVQEEVMKVHQQYTNFRKEVEDVQKNQTHLSEGLLEFHFYASGFKKIKLEQDKFINEAFERLENRFIEKEEINDGPNS